MLNIDLSGKIALVTGASGELGRVIARTLAECGADVAVHYNGSRERAEQTADSVRALGRRALVVQADVTDLASVLAMRDQIKASLGTQRPERMVSCAALF